MKRLLVLLFSLLLPITLSARPWPQPFSFRGISWIDSGFDCRKKIIVLSSEVDATLTDFPVYLDLADLGTDFHSGVKSDGSDIRITTGDQVTQIPREVVVIDTSGETGEVHFKAPSLSGTADTTFYIYYCNSSATEPAAASTNGSQNVWTNGYQGVWHLEEDQAGIGNVDLYQDSTANANHGDDQISATVQTGQIGAGNDFDGTDDYIQTSSNELATANNFTISLWVNADSTAFADHILWEGEGTGQGWGSGVDNCTSNQDEMHLTFGRLTDADSAESDFINFFMGCTITSAGGNMNISSASFTDTTSYHHIAATVANISTSPAGELYLDGASVGTDTATTGDVTRDGWDTDFRIGRPGAAERFLDGLADEVRIADIARTSTWISTVFNNQDSPSTFYNIGPEEMFQG